MLFKVKSEEGVITKPLTLKGVPPFIVIGVPYKTVSSWEKEVLKNKVMKPIVVRRRWGMLSYLV
jgi:hypothetical protein